MSSTASTITPLFVQNASDYVRIVYPDGSISYEQKVHRQQPTKIHRSYAKSKEPKYRYTLEQEGKSYRCCQWCRYWCTRNCPTCNFCDRIVACPLFTLLLTALFLLFLFMAVLTLFGLDPNINPSRRYYGVISTLSIVNQTTYVYGLDSLCNKYGTIKNCLNLTTSTSVVNLATTVTINRAMSINNSSYFFILASSSSVLILINHIQSKYT